MNWNGSRLSSRRQLLLWLAVSTVLWVAVFEVRFGGQGLSWPRLVLVWLIPPLLLVGVVFLWKGSA